MTPRRILLVTLEPPAAPGRAAGKWYAVLLRELVARGHRVTAFAACSDPADIEHARHHFPAPEYDLRCYPFPVRRGLGAKVGSLLRPLSYPFSAELRRDLARELANGYDVLHLEQLPCGWLAPSDRSRTLVNVHFLHALDLPDRPPPGLRAWADWHRLRESERRLLRRFRHIRVLSDRMAAAVRDIHPGAQLSVGVNGLDPADYPYLPDDRRPTEPVVGVIGNMHWPPSRTAADRLLTRIWPAVRKRVPGTRALIVGWGAAEHFARFAATPGVSIVGDAAEVRSHFEGMGVLLYAPGRGSGTKVKVLEALGYGVPVVTNADGAEGLPAVDGVHAGVCEADAGLVERAVRLLADPAAANRQRAAGRALLEAHCGPGPTVDGVEAAYRLMPGGSAG